MDPHSAPDAPLKGMGSVVHAPCPQCGGQLRFSARHQQLHCEHCQHQEAIDFTRQRLQENPLHAGLGASVAAPRTAEQRVFACRNCGAQTTVGDDVPTITCAFCGSRNVNPEAHQTRLIEPAGVLPFRVAREQADEKFRHWVGSSLLAPSNLRKTAVLDLLHGLYVPYWTFDAEATSHWTAEAGYHYYVSVEGRDDKGNRVTRREQRTRWEYQSGTHHGHYDDLLVPGSNRLPLGRAHVADASHYDLQAVVDYDPRVLLGWEAEVYTVDLPAATTQAEEELRAREEQACSRQVGGDTQRNLNVQTELTAQTYKHLLLPLWLCTYQYRGKLYRFMVNGQTGEIAGERPLSFWKVALLVLLVLAAVLLLLYVRDRTR